MKIKSTVLQVLAAASLGAGLLYAMGIEGGAQLGGTITDGEFTTAMVLILAALALMRISFAVQDAEEQARRKVHKEPQNTVKSRKKVADAEKKLINLLYTLALYAKDKLLDAEIWALKCTVRTLEAQGRILDRVLKLTKEADA